MVSSALPFVVIVAGASYYDPGQGTRGGSIILPSRFLPIFIYFSIIFCGRTQFVSTREEMVEKILLFDDNLDDRPLELLKHYIRETNLGNGDDPDQTILYYGGRGVFEDEGEVIFIDKLSGTD